MKILRILLISTILVGAFLYITSRTDWGRRAIFRPLANAGKAWLDPDVAKSAGLSTDEINNIDIYKLANLATVNNLGLLYANQGKMDEAEKMYQRALQEYEKV